MYKDLLNILRCPICKSKFNVEEKVSNSLEIIEGILICEHNHSYCIKDRIIDFNSLEQSNINDWSKIYEDISPEDFDEKMDNIKSEKEKEYQKILIDELISSLKGSKSGVVVDIATGRGLLLNELCKQLNNTFMFVATDLSYDVLKHDQIKFDKLYPDTKVNYLVCDATNLPFDSNSVDTAISYFGIANMEDKIEDGIQEVNRILKKEGKFFNAFILIKKDSKGYIKLSEFSSNEVADKFLENESFNLHRKYFEKARRDILIEDIYQTDSVDIDLLPYPNEWIAEGIYKCEK